MLKSISFGIGLVFSLTACQVQSAKESASSTKIVGGVHAMPLDVVTYSTVSLTLTSGGSVTVEPTSFCSGVVVAENKVVTAASCFKEDIEDLRTRGAVLNIVFGTNGTLLTASRVATSVKLHPQYKAELVTAPTPAEPANDIAIVSFEGGLPENHGVTAIAAQDLVLAPSEREVFTIAGYGVSDPTSDETGILRQGSVKFASVIDLANVIQFRGTNVSACDGDSGGPAYRMQNGNISVVGVVSSANCKSFMRYTDLRKYGTFISE